MSWSSVVWLVVAVVAGYWVITSGFIQNFAMGLGGGSKVTPGGMSRMPKGRMRRG